jgi:hypothetical protein
VYDSHYFAKADEEQTEHWVISLLAPDAVNSQLKTQPVANLPEKHTA